MRTVLVWLISVICSIVNPFGILILIAFLCEEKYDLLLVPAIAGGVGFLFGFIFWDEMVAPRMFWVKSRTEVFDNRVNIASKYMFSFFNCACAVVWLVAFVL